MRRVVIVGIAGSGKTTTARRLGRQLELPAIELDELNHGPKWSEVDATELRRRVEAGLRDAPNGWVAEPSYVGKLDHYMWERADTGVWLDPPLRVCLWRIWRRTWRGILRNEELWHGNRESIRGAFLTRDSLFRGACRAHHRNPRAIPERAARNPHVRLVRLGSADAVERWLENPVSR